MSWQRRYFKGQQVWVEVDDLENPILTEGRIKMRYSDDEEAKTYRANPANISSSSADVVDAEKEFEKPKSKKSGTKSAPKPITTAESPDEWGPRRETFEVPDELIDIDPPPPGVIEIYTDGACSGNPGPCGLGAILRDGDSYHDISQYLGHGTNNIAELMAIKVALEQVDEDQRDRPVRLHSDSTYCIGVLTKGWKAKANRELILSLRKLVDEFSDITFIKVKGHSDHPLNDRADFLATSSLEYR